MEGALGLLQLRGVAGEMADTYRLGVALYHPTYICVLPVHVRRCATGVFARRGGGGFGLVIVVGENCVQIRNHPCLKRRGWS